VKLRGLRPAFWGLGRADYKEVPMDQALTPEAALSPEEIRATTFTTSLRGYDKEEVDHFLSALSDAVADLKDASEHAYRNLGERMGNLLQQAKDAADDIVETARTETAGIRQEAETAASKVRQEAENAARETEQEADRKASEIRASSEQDAQQREQEAERRLHSFQEAEAVVRQRLQALREELGRVTSALSQIETSGTEAIDAPAAADGEAVSSQSPSMSKAEAPAPQEQTIVLEPQSTSVTRNR
jgi:DivIVA domain-containing protein